jgi:sugar/nucleoside kinase (ribokinase family)
MQDHPASGRSARPLRRRGALGHHRAHLPAAPSRRRRAGRIGRQPGGVALNVALALAASGVPAALLAAVGRDAEGDALLAETEARGVDCGAVLRHDGPTDSYLALEDGAGEVFAAVADCAGLERAGLDVLRPLAEGGLERPWTGWIVADGNLPRPS